MNIHRIGTSTSVRDGVRRAGVAMSLAGCLSMFAGGAIVSVTTPGSVSAQSTSVVGLHLGSQGRSVRDVQAALIDKGVWVGGGVDGVFGASTERALKAFQKWNGLRQTGTVDSATAGALDLEVAPDVSSGSGLRLGVRGSDVKDVQRALTRAGYRLDGGVDGIFGPSTEAAVKAFQRSKGLAVDGIVGSQTSAALGIGSSPSSPTPSAGGTLREGSRGDAVRAVQQAIVRAGGFLLGGIDGIYGPGTTSAVKAYQIVNDLKVTGVVDAATGRLMGVSIPGNSASNQPDSTPSTGYVGLRVGSRGATVRALQKALIGKGIYVLGGADGTFGPATSSALKQFQSSHGLSATGVVSQGTAEALGLIGGGGTPSGATSGYVGLRQGSSGTRVKAVQEALMDTGLVLLGGADGFFGPATTSALKLYQKVNGLPVTGAVDAATAKLMGLGSEPATTAMGFPAYGERSSRVRTLQQALINAGLSFNGGADGSFGAATTGAIIRFQQRRGLPVTGKVDSATANALGLQPMAAPAPITTRIRIARFPVAAPCWYGDTWLAPRGGGRMHLGVDIVAASGTRLYAADSGTITTLYHNQAGSLSGNGLKITRSDGTYFFYAHLSRFARGIRVGSRVSAGQVVGYVGNTGNSATSHLHFEVHPLGGSAVNPYPIVKAVDAC